jgi:hypothetical protein
MHNSGQDFVTAIEYQLVTPSDPTHVFLGISAVDYPDNMSVKDGDPFAGHSIAYWPPLDGRTPGYNMMCHYTCFTVEPCWNEGGILADYPIVVAPHPDTGEIRGTFWPGHLFFGLGGMTSTLCPFETATEAKSWGAIKSLYR